MNAKLGFDKCLTFINCQLQPPQAHYGNGLHWQVVTLSRQTGSGGHAVAEILAALLQARTPETSRPWTVFDRNLVEQVLADHNLPKRLARFMPEDRISEMTDTMDELFGLHPSSWTLVRKTAETILRLAELRNAILIGRGANVITHKLDYAFHMRLVGSPEKRCEHLQLLNGLSRRAALELMRREENGRRRYLKKYFNKDIDDPLLYHMVINTDWVPYAEAAQLIADAVWPKSLEAEQRRGQPGVE